MKSTVTGSMRWCVISKICSFKLISRKFELVKPPIGNQPVFTAKINSKTAKKNEGIAMPILVKTVKILSVFDFHLKAASIPRGIPTIHVSAITIVVSKRVFGILSLSFDETFSPFEVIPKSPLTKDFAHFPY